MSNRYTKPAEVPTEILVSCLKQLSDAIADPTVDLREFCVMRIPAQLDRDMDLIVMEAATRLEKLSQNQIE